MEFSWAGADLRMREIARQKVILPSSFHGDGRKVHPPQEIGVLLQSLTYLSLNQWGINFIFMGKYPISKIVEPGAYKIL